MRGGSIATFCSEGGIEGCLVESGLKHPGSDLTLPIPHGIGLQGQKFSVLSANGYDLILFQSGEQNLLHAIKIACEILLNTLRSTIFANLFICVCTFR